MKKVTKIFTWGGVSALLVALIVSISLAVVPQNLTNEYGNDGVTHAATEVIDGLEWITVEVRKVNDLRNTTYRTQNVCYILQNDIDVTSITSGNATMYGQRIILDLHGYTMKIAGGGSPVFNNECFFAEIRDSSPAGSGRFDNSAGSGNLTIYASVPQTTMIFSGGTMISTRFILDVYGTGNLNVELRGGHYETINGDFYRTSFAENLNLTTTAAGYITTIDGANEQLQGFKIPDYFAVSTTPYATGIYNYVYGYKWEIDVTALRDLVVPADRDYYVWGRFADGAYEYLYKIV